MKKEQFSFTRIPDWQNLRKRYGSVWINQGDGVVIAHIQNPNPNRPEPETWMVEASDEKYLNPEKFYKLSCWRRTSWNWHADLFQYVLASYGPNVFVGFCGGQPVFGADTVWHDPVINSLDEADKIHFDEDNYYWKIHLETVQYFSEKCAGQKLLGMTDFGGPADWISTLMGTEKFLFASIEEPEKMRNFALRLVQECSRAYDILYPMIISRNDGLVNWMPVWFDGRLGTIQDDMAINFSPEMYKEIFAPAMREQAAHTERTVLHWHDGCAHHLDTFLNIDEIDLIQYGHDPNTGPFRGKINDMKAIQSTGRALFISCIDACDAKFFIDNLKPSGLFMIIDTTSDEESKKMEENVNKWVEERKVSISKG